MVKLERGLLSRGLSENVYQIAIYLMPVFLQVLYPVIGLGDIARKAQSANKGSYTT